MNDDEARRAKAGQLVAALNARDLEWFDALYHDDVVIHWPQSGEVIRGKHNLRELRQAYPTPPTATRRRILGAGDLWAIELDFDYHGDRCHVIVIHQ
jgi:ketosteroid isomerase-like protein